jgi:two-component system, NtrC family, sensor histidine kinase HydH
MPLRRNQLAIAGIYLAIATITALHYFTSPHQHQLHDIYRRLYYLPIILAAFMNGLRGGLIASIIVCLLYAPHAWAGALGLHGHLSHDPATPTQKILEMILYLAVGTVTGTLVSRLKGTQRRLESTAGDLEQSIHQLRSAEEKLVQEAQLAAVGRLSAGLAHEIRNPLASIKGSAELLADDFGPENPKRRLLQVLVDEAIRLNGVLTRFLAFARPSPVQRERVDAAGELETVVTLVRQQLANGSSRDALTVGGRTQPLVRFDSAGSEGLALFVDPQQMRQVLFNVTLNAIQACGDKGEVILQSRRRENRAVITVSDTGSGFTREALTNAFTPFFTTRPEGTGLGLAITHRIVEQHGGSIRLANRPEGGGVVEIELPCDAAPGA